MVKFPWAWQKVSGDLFYSILAEKARMGRLLKITLAAALILIGGCGDIDEMILVKRRSDAGDMSGKNTLTSPEEEVLTSKQIRPYS